MLCSIESFTVQEYGIRIMFASAEYLHQVKDGMFHKKQGKVLYDPNIDPCHSFDIKKKAYIFLCPQS